MKTKLTPLPEEGIYTKDGLLFHQVRVDGIMDNERIARLKEFGIPYETGQFTPHEDEILLRNWKEYAEENNIPFLDALSFMSKTDDKKKNNDRQKLKTSTAFLSRICQDLPHRSGPQVYVRMRRVLSPAMLNGSDTISYRRKNTISGAEKLKLFQLYRKLKDWVSVGEVLGRIPNRCSDTYWNHLRSAENKIVELPQLASRRLWDQVIEQTVIPPDDSSTQDDISFAKAIKKAIFENDVARLRYFEKRIPFFDIAIELMTAHLWCKNNWILLMDKLLTKFNEKQNNEMLPRIAWKSVFNEIFGDLPHISVPDYCIFLELLAKATPDTRVLSPLRSRYYRLRKLEKRLVKSGVTDFFCDEESEVEFLIGKTRKILERSQKLLFDRIRRRFSLKERLSIVKLAFEKEIKVAPVLPKVELVMFNGRLAEQVTNKPNVFPSLRTPSLVEALIEYSTTTQENWIPPTKLRKYVESENILKLFSNEKNNEELLNKGDRVDSYLSDSESESDEIGTSQVDVVPAEGEKQAADTGNTCLNIGKLGTRKNLGCFGEMEFPGNPRERSRETGAPVERRSANRFHVHRRRTS